MSISVNFELPNEKNLEFIAQHMREADIAEITASCGFAVRQALKSSVRLSDWCFVLTFEEEPVAVIGLVRSELNPSLGSPWMLGTDSIDKHPAAFFKTLKYVIGVMLCMCSYLGNFVHAKNEKSVRFLSHIGFILDEPKPFGTSGELFHKFYIGETQCALTQ